MEKEFRIDILRCLKAIARKWYLILLIGLLLSGGVFGLTYGKQKEYRGYTTIYSAIYGSYTATAESMKAVQLNAKLVNSSKIATRAVSIMGNNKLSATEVQDMISVDFSDESPVLEVSALSKDANLAVAVANAVAEAFVIEASNITGNEGVQILDKAVEAEEVQTKMLLFCLFAFVGGALVTAFFVAVAEINSDRVYHVEDAELNGEIPLLGIIPNQVMKL